MKLSDIEYAKCECGIIYPLASLKPKAHVSDPDVYIEHDNKKCRACMHKDEQEQRKKGVMH